MENLTIITSQGPKTIKVEQYDETKIQGNLFLVRPGTYDATIFEDVVLRNEYGLPEKFAKHDVVIDVGAHIGSFSYAALIRGAAKVYAYEAHPINYAVAMKNLEKFGERVVCRDLAVWRSDVDTKTLFNDSLVSYDKPNTGGFSVVFNSTGLPVETISLDEILFEASGGLKTGVRMLKIDCEGAEYPILFTSKYLSIIEKISGEYHDIPDEIVPLRAKIDGFDKYNRHSLKSFLETKGFRVELIEKEGTCGLFHARRKGLFASLLQSVWGGNTRGASPRVKEPASVKGPALQSGWAKATAEDIYYCYRLLLDREPDPEGWCHWKSKIENEMGVQEMVEGFLRSEEFHNKREKK